MRDPAGGRGSRLTPLALSLRSGAEIMQPLALCVNGGLLVSMLLTLLVIPCLYLIVGAFAERLKSVLLTGRFARPASVMTGAVDPATQSRRLRRKGGLALSG